MCCLPFHMLGSLDVERTHAHAHTHAALRRLVFGSDHYLISYFVFFFGYVLQENR